MNEIQFLHKNIRRWEDLEKLLQSNSVAEPDHLSDLYIALTDDLAYARTFYPRSKTHVYLNQLTQKAHAIIYKNKPTSKNKVIEFWQTEFPLLVYSLRKPMGVAFAVFLISVFIGILSHKNDVGFARIIMGDSYINMTLANIEKGDPLAIYKEMNQVDMFLGISVNNIRVSFFAFIMGMITAIGSGFILLQNGIMLGTFHAFLGDHGLVLESIATIWVHGTLEIFAIIVAGGAGITLGNSFIFPGTYTRAQSFRRGAGKGAKTVLGLVPVFLVAGFLEGFVTRYTDAPYAVRFGIIGLSLAFIVFYFYIYPRKLLSKNMNHGRN